MHMSNIDRVRAVSLYTLQASTVVFNCHFSCHCLIHCKIPRYPWCHLVYKKYLGRVGGHVGWFIFLSNLSSVCVFLSLPGPLTCQALGFCLFMNYCLMGQPSGSQTLQSPLKLHHPPRSSPCFSEGALITHSNTLQEQRDIIIISTKSEVFRVWQSVVLFIKYSWFPSFWFIKSCSPLTPHSQLWLCELFQTTMCEHEWI